MKEKKHKLIKEQFLPVHYLSVPTFLFRGRQNEYIALNADDVR